MEKLFKWGTATLALVPGLTLMLANLWVPAEISRLLLGGIMQAIGVFTLFFFQRTETMLKKKPPLKLIRLGVFFWALFIVSLTIYIFIFLSQNIYNSKYDTYILIPFWMNDDLKYMVNQAGNVDKAISNYGPEAIRQAVNDSTSAMPVTKILFILNYILTFEFLVIAFGFITIKFDKSRRPR